MLNKLTQLRDDYYGRKEEGFTIVEVMIVLAIAGLIILIVFLAVPALQRNSRNTQIRNDVGAVLGGMNEYAANNNGRLPTSVSGTGTVTLSRGASTPTQTVNVQGQTTVSIAASAPSSVDPGNIEIRIGRKCDGSASNRAIAAYYAVETTGSPQLQCQDS